MPASLNQKRWTLVLAVSLTLAPVAVGADESQTGVEQLSAEVVADRLEVVGRGVFVDVPASLGVDDVDASIQGLGMDLVEATISRSDPFADSLRFTLEVADPMSQGSAPPETRANVDFFIDDAPFDCRFSATRTKFLSDLDPHFNVACPLWVSVEVEGRWVGSTIEWDVPLSALNSGSASRLGGRAGEEANATLHLLAWNDATAVDELTLTGEYIIPSPEVALGVAPAGTSPAEVPLTQVASVQSDGTFSASIDSAGLEPGEYVVAARACYGAGNCGLAITSVSLPG